MLVEPNAVTTYKDFSNKVSSRSSSYMVLLLLDSLQGYKKHMAKLLKHLAMAALAL